MDIDKYCREHSQTVAGLAAKIGLHRGHLHKIATGERGFTSKTALAIERATGGKVTANDLMRTRRTYLAKQARQQKARA